LPMTEPSQSLNGLLDQRKSSDAAHTKNIEQKCRTPTVGIVKLISPCYPAESPYNPSEIYPEYPFSGHISAEQNYVYDGVRKLFFELGLDREHWGTSGWNPLEYIVKPGMTVVIKPNFVLSRHAENKNIFSIITHPSVLRAVADYCWIALKGSGKIIIADAPQYNCNFSELQAVTNLDKICDLYHCFAGPQTHFFDLRDYWSETRHFPSCVRKLPGDPKGNITVNLGSKSALFNHPNPRKFYGAVYHRTELIGHHISNVQEYQLSRTILEADVIISIPKLKVHKKVGVTLNAKGLVGICTNKNLLLHYTLGPPSKGGDQYPDGLFSDAEEMLIRLERWMYDNLLARRNRLLEYVHRTAYWLHHNFIKPFGWTVAKEKRLLDTGNWYGNDSAWRMAADLLKIIYFADKEGRLHDTPQRRLFSVIDGVIGGENKGPLVPDPKNAGVLLAGDNFLAVDIVATRLMGFDPMKLRLYSNALKDSEFNCGIDSIENIKVVCADKRWKNCLVDKTSRFLDFTPYPGWVGQIEI